MRIAMMSTWEECASDITKQTGKEAWPTMEEDAMDDVCKSCREPLSLPHLHLGLDEARPCHPVCSEGCAIQKVKEATS
jgi:hypothetical protein